MEDSHISEFHHQLQPGDQSLSLIEEPKIHLLEGHEDAYADEDCAKLTIDFPV